jgi:hypothetical protein
VRRFCSTAYQYYNLFNDQTGKNSEEATELAKQLIRLLHNLTIAIDGWNIPTNVDQSKSALYSFRPVTYIYSSQSVQQ